MNKCRKKTGKKRPRHAPASRNCLLCWKHALALTDNTSRNEHHHPSTGSRFNQNLVRSVFITETIGISVSASVEGKFELGGSIGTRRHWRTDARDGGRGATVRRGGIVKVLEVGMLLRVLFQLGNGSSLCRGVSKYSEGVTRESKERTSILSAS